MAEIAVLEPAAEWALTVRETAEEHAAIGKEVVYQPEILHELVGVPVFDDVEGDDEIVADIALRKIGERCIVRDESVPARRFAHVGVELDARDIGALAFRPARNAPLPKPISSTRLPASGTSRNSAAR